MTIYLVVGVPESTPQYESFSDHDAAEREYENWRAEGSTRCLQLLEIKPKPAGFKGCYIEILREN